MSKRGPDYQKQEAKQSLWDMDGQHIWKVRRNKGKGRGKDKRLIFQELDESRKSCEDESNRVSETD